MEENNSKWLERARDSYNGSTDYFDTNIRAQIEADIRQWQGKHPTGSKYYSEAYRTRSKLFRNKTRAAGRKNEAACAAAFFSTEDVISVRPDDEDDFLQVMGADALKFLVTKRLSSKNPKKAVPWFMILNGAYQEAMSVGVVCSYQHWEYKKAEGIDRPVVELQPVENIRISPASKWYDPINTSPYVIRMIPMYVQDVMARMEVDEKGASKWKPLEKSVVMAATKHSYDTIRQAREGQRTDSKDAPEAVTDYSIVWVHENIIKDEKGRDMVYFTLGTEHLLSDPKPLKEVYWHGRRPLVMGISILEAHKVYPSSLPSISRDNQREINDLANLRMDNVRFVLNKRYFAKRNRQVDIRSLTRNVPGSVTLMNDIDDVKVVETNDVTRSSYEEQDRLNLEFDDLVGSFSGSSVSSNRKMNETVGGMNLLANSAGQVGEYQLRTFAETWVEPVLAQLVELEKFYESDKDYLRGAARYAKIAKTLGVPERLLDTVPEVLMQGDFHVVVNVGIGASNPGVQVEKFVYGMTSLRDILGEQFASDINEEEVVKELMGKLGFKDGSRFFRSLAGEEDPRVTQLMSVVDQLQQALAAKEPPELVAAKVDKLRAEINNINSKTLQSGVESRFAAMQAAENVAAIPELAPIADDILEASGYRNPQVQAPNMLPGPGMIERMAAMYGGGGMGGGGFDVPENTSPLQPPVPQSPYQGIEGGEEAGEPAGEVEENENE